MCADIVPVPVREFIHRHSSIVPAAGAGRRAPRRSERGWILWADTSAIGEKREHALKRPVSETTEDFPQKRVFLPTIYLVVSVSRSVALSLRSLHAAPNEILGLDGAFINAQT